MDGVIPDLRLALQGTRVAWTIRPFGLGPDGRVAPVQECTGTILGVYLQTGPGEPTCSLVQRDGRGDVMAVRHRDLRVVS